MTDDDDEVAESNALDADDRALAVHEAGHAAVAHAFGAGVVSVEIEVATGNGETVHGREIANIENLAVLVAGYKAELNFAAHELKLSKMLSAHAVRSTRDHQQMQELLLRWPEGERLAVLVEGFRLADEKLKANADVVLRITDALFARKFEDKARIDGKELTSLLTEVRTS